MDDRAHAVLCVLSWHGTYARSPLLVKELASVVAAIGSNHQPVAIDRARIDRQIWRFLAIRP